MSQAVNDTTTPDAASATVLPSILEIGRLIQAIDLRAGHYDEVHNDRSKGHPEKLDAGVGFNLAMDRQTALSDLAMTMIPQSLGDVAVQLYLGFLEIDFLQAHDLDSDEIERRVTKLRRLVAGMLPVVATAPQITLAEVCGDDTAKLVAREHQPVEA